MWRSKFLRQLVIVAFLGVVILSVMEWRLHAGAETQVDQERARERLATAALVLDEESASLAVAYGDGGDLSHLDLTGPIDALDPDAVEAAGRVARAQVVVLRAEGERSDVVARSLERAEPPAAGTQAATGAAAAPLVAELPILRASDGATLGFLRVHGSVAATSIHPTWLTLAAPVVAFFFLVGGIVVVYVYDRKTFQRIAAQVRDLADGATDVDFGDFPPSGTIYPMAQALMDLRRRYDEAAEKNNAALKSEMAARAELDGMLTQLDAEMGCLIGDLARGDFSQRILSQFEFAEIQSLAVSIQSMADTMENFLKETAHVLTAMAEGDLRVEMSGAYAGEFDAVARSANGSIHQVRALIGDVQDAVADGLAAVARISGSVEDLARRANDQVAAIQETASAMEQISTAVRTNTEAMVEADRMARDVALSTEAGGVAARGAIAAVERIRDSSKEISDIVRVIETIAFQTTILALNSAIEAARAGEAGRGFSVVATEVRSLAQRSSDAAKEIKKLITSSEQMVIEGVEMVQSAGSALHEIDAGIQNLSTRIAQVARSQIEQSTAIGQINANVANIESLAAESAALCESSGDETQALSVSMERVGAQMDRFRVDRPKAFRAPAPASTARGPDVLERPVRTADELPKWEEPEDTRGWTVEDWARAAG